MACRFLKETVKGNKMMKRLKDAAEGNKANVEVQEELSKLSERYYVLCKKADSRVKNMQSLLFEVSTKKLFSNGLFIYYLTFLLQFLFSGNG